MKHALRALTVVGLTAAAMAGCGGDGQSAAPGNTPAGESAPAALSGVINVDGSSTVYPITEAAAEEFRKTQPNVNVTVGISGTGGGFKKFSRGETDISNASRPIKSSEAEAAAANNIEFIELPVAYDALSVVVNPQNDWAKDITVAELKKIWEPAAQGKITNWNQVRSSWPDRPLKLYGAGSDSGTFDYFTDAINGKEGAMRGDYTPSEDDNVLVQGVSRDPNALGFFGVAYYQENSDKLKALPIDDEDESNGAGPQEPTDGNVRAGTYQPLARPIFIYVAKSSVAKPALRSFVEFYLERAATLVAEVRYIPLQPEVYELVGQRFKKGVTGSIFSGGSQVGVKLDELLKKEAGS